MGAHELLFETGAGTQLPGDSGRLASTQAMLAWDCASASDTGRERPHNEDAIYLNASSGLLLLADGMGGYNAGEVASRMAIEQARDTLIQMASDEADAPVTAALQRAFFEANAAILAAAARRPECLGMGTTLVGAVVHNHLVSFAHVGDSRLYLLRNRQLARLTHDHSVGQAMIDAGVLDERAARLSTLRGVLTRALGVEPAVDADAGQFEWQAGDRLLLCSDGLTDMIDDAQIASVMAAEGSALEIAGALVHAALDAGGHDNVSVVLACCGRPGAR